MGFSIPSGRCFHRGGEHQGSKDTDLSLQEGLENIKESGRSSEALRLQTPDPVGKRPEFGESTMARERGEDQLRQNLEFHGAMLTGDH